MNLPLFDQMETVAVATPNIKNFPSLYNLDSNGRLRVWTIRVDGNDGSAVIITESGLTAGAKIKTEIPVTAGRNIGRSNETTPWTQALAEAESKWRAQIRSGYCENPENCRKDTLGSGIPAPMLAHIYSPEGAAVKNSKTLEKMKLSGQKIHVQPKFDGVRCLVRVRHDRVELFTRKGDRMQSVPHIEREIRRSYDENFTGNVQLILDGELYTDKFSFNALNGLLRREEKTAEHFRQLETVKYHLYDLMSEEPYETRYSIINTYFHNSRSVVTVPSYPITAADDEIRRMMEIFLNQGYEGLMIRRLDTPYEHKRSWSLCKYKDFQDAEYRLADIIEDARGGGIIGAFVLELPGADGGETKTFRAGIKDLTQEESRKMLAAKNSFIGKWATVEFFSLSEYGVPRFPKVKGFRSDV